jgi:hypothetical protein
MNTTTAAAPSAAATSSSSLATSSKFKTFAITFSTSGTAAYCIIQYFNWPLFTFHPGTNRIVWGYEAARAGEGPNMLWYGWSATTIIVAAVLGIIAMTLPDRITRKLPLTLVWLLPILAIPYVIYSLMPWWTHP